LKGLLVFEPARIRAFGVYYVIAAASHAFESCVKVAAICTEAKIKPEECESARVIIGTFEALQVLLFLYFAHVIFSLDRKMRVEGRDGLLRGLDLRFPWLPSRLDDVAVMPRALQMERPSQDADLEEFAGEGRRIDSPGGCEDEHFFTGKAVTLE
jgi:hypothetical protein